MFVGVYMCMCVSVCVCVFVLCVYMSICVDVCTSAISHSSQCSTTGVTKVVVCVILSVGWCI